MRHRRSCVLLAVALVLVACGPGASASAAIITIGDAWARPAPAGGQSAAYLTIANTGAAADALLSVSSPVADMVGLHQTSTDAAGVTGMRPVARLEIPAGGSALLEPGGYHVMLMGLTGELAVGKTIELDLTFEHAGRVVVTATIRQG